MRQDSGLPKYSGIFVCVLFSFFVLHMPAMQSWLGTLSRPAAAASHGQGRGRVCMYAVHALGRTFSTFLHVFHILDMGERRGALPAPVRHFSAPLAAGTSCSSMSYIYLSPAHNM
ncbi:hypothetical protein F5883DRAFT_553458 [Diaporthe sp. PMI_573]|nr:hypothetical protein F5883DRAFT_553458 [Diaporthaceae sp. PMI_573]